MRKALENVVQYIFVLIASVMLFSFVGYYFIQDVVFYITKEQTTCTIKSIDKYGTDEKPYRIKVEYFKKLNRESVMGYVFVNEDYKNRLSVNDSKDILCSRFVNNLYFVDFENLKFITVFIEFASLIILIIAGYFSVINLKKLRHS